MEVYELKYFSTKDSICAADFEREHIVKINIKYIVSISELFSFYTPLSGRYVSDYSIVSMVNKDRFLIKKEAYSNLIKVLELN